MTINYFFSNQFHTQSVSYYLDQLDYNYTVIYYQDIFGGHGQDPIGFDKIVQIVQESKEKNLLFIACDHPHDNIDFVENKIKEHLPDTNLKTITGDGRYCNKVSNKFYYPYYWYALLPGQQNVFPAWTPNTASFADTKPFVASCLNNLCRYHRIKLLDNLYNKSYFAQILYSFNSSEAHDNYDLPDMQTLLFKYRNILPLRIDRTSPDFTNDLISLQHVGLYNAYLNIVTSNHPDVCFVDEKLFKPIASGQLYLTLSGPGTIQLLRNLGFDVFDDILDHSYDVETDLDKRIVKLVNSIDNWMAANHDQIWKQTYLRRLKNAEQFFNLDVNQNPFQDFLKQ